MVGSGIGRPRRGGRYPPAAGAALTRENVAILATAGLVRQLSNRAAELISLVNVVAPADVRPRRES